MQHIPQSYDQLKIGNNMSCYSWKASAILNRQWENQKEHDFKWNMVNCTIIQDITTAKIGEKQLSIRMVKKDAKIVFNQYTGFT